MSSLSGTLGYIGFACLLMLAAFLTFLIFILKSYQNSNYEEECSSTESKKELTNGKNLTIGGIILCSFLIGLFLIITISAIVISVKSKSKAGVFTEFGRNVGRVFNPIQVY